MMEKHTSKKLLAGILALSAGFVLASCDPISATPTNYNDAIVLDESNNKVDLEDNVMGKIYDNIASDRNTKIVSTILDEVATKKFGDYYEIMKATRSEAERNEYINKHAAVFKREGEAEALTLARFDAFIEDIEERISEVFYNEIVSGSYNDDDGKFSEEKLWNAHHYELYDLDGKAAAQGVKFYVTSELTKENAKSKLAGTYDVLAKRDAYEASHGENEKFAFRGYIEEKIFPQVIKDKLVEEYVMNDESAYASLGRTYARKVSYIKVSYEDIVIPWELVKKFGREFVDKDVAMDFEDLVKAIKGFNGINSVGGVIPLATTDNAYKLLDGVVTDTVLLNHDIKYLSDVIIPSGTYFKNTKIGELVSSYKKAEAAVEQGRFPTTSNKIELDKFLGSGKSMEYGLREKVISLAKEDYTTDGWFVKNGGLSELPSALRDRLFNINVASILDDDSKLVLEKEGVNMGAYEYDVKNPSVKLTKRPYLRNINGKKFVIPATCQDYAENPYSYIYKDIEGKAFYMVQVLEAPSTPKLNKEQASSYAKNPKFAEEPFKTEEIARQVAKVLSTKDAYIKDAYTDYLKNYDFIFYETSLYEHFKSEYPDLFDDED